MKLDILVYACWHPLENSVPMGLLSASYLKGKETFAFEFDRDWLKRPKNPKLDPDLPLVRGKSFPQAGKPNCLGGSYCQSGSRSWYLYV